MLHEKMIGRKEFEEKLYSEVCRAGREVYAAALERFDKELHKARNRRAYRDKGLRGTVIKTLMGEVEYKRHVYSFTDEDGKPGTVYLLDEAVGRSGSGFISEALTERIAESVCEMPYRKAAAEIGSLTGQSLSHTAVWNVTQKLGGRVDEKERADADSARQNKGRGKREVKLLFEEQDGVWLHLQGKDRKACGKSREMKLAIAYDGAVKTGKKRYELTNKVACANFEGVKEFYRRKEGLIAANYNVDEIEMRVLNGDGASWIKESIGGDTVYQLDTFHRNQAVIRAVHDKSIREEMLRLLYAKEIEHLILYIETLADGTEDEGEAKALHELHTYFSNNKDGLIMYKRRGLKLPEPPEGMVYRRLGAAESNIFSIIGNRMKGRRHCWSMNGGNNLAKLLCLKATGKLHDTILGLTGFMPEKYAAETESPLSASKVKESVGKGYDGFGKASLQASPFWLRAAAGIKPFSELSF